MITLTLQEAIEIRAAMDLLPKLPIKGGYAISRIRDPLIAELKRASEQEMKLIEEHGAKLEGQTLTWPDDSEEAQTAYRAEWLEFVTTEFTINRDPVSIELLCGGKEEIDHRILSALGKILKD